MSTVGEEKRRKKVVLVLQVTYDDVIILQLDPMSTPSRADRQPLQRTASGPTHLCSANPGSFYVGLLVKYGIFFKYIERLRRSSIWNNINRFLAG